MSRVCVVDDHLLFAESLAALLNARGIPTTAVSAADHAGLVTAIRSERPEVVLLDLDLGPLGDSSPMIAALAPWVRVVVLSGTAERWRLARALELGAIGVQAKSSRFEELLAVTERALTTTGHLDPSGSAVLLAELGQRRAQRAHRFAPFDRLTEREGAVLVALATGLPVRQIAAAWVVSEATVRSHVRQVLSELGVCSQLEAVAAAHESGWLAERAQRTAHTPGSRAV
jgi:DNA-binding NarL/FixJ family response regulator